MESTTPAVLKQNHALKILGIPEFAEKTIRITPDGKRVSAIDLVSLASDQTKENASFTFNRLRDRYDEVCTNIADFKFPGRGQRETPTLDAEGVVKVF